MPVNASTPGWPIVLSTTLAFALHASVLAVDVFHPTQVSSVSRQHGESSSVHVRVVVHNAAESALSSPLQAKARWTVSQATGGRRTLETRLSPQGYGLKEQTAAADSMLPSVLMTDLEPVAEPRSDVQGDAYTGFLPADILDTVPRPYTAPDLSALTGRTRSGLPVNATLLIATDGTVLEVLPSHALLQDDQQWFANIRETFLSMRFTPGRLGGLDVASRLQISVELEGLVLED